MLTFAIPMTRHNPEGTVNVVMLYNSQARTTAGLVSAAV